MLVELTVTDYGIFDRASVVLGPGFCTLTGETGAGKSLVVGAIQLLLGARADSSVVRPGASEAIVDGRFETNEGEELILTRVIAAEGRSRAYCNGRPVTVGELAARSQGLVELHGQHAHQQLLRTANQRDALDRFAGVDLEPLRTVRARIAEIDDALARLGGDERTRAREAEVLRFQLDELDAAGLDDPDEDASLDAEENTLADAVAHQEAGARAVEALTGDGGVNDLASEAVGALRGRTPFADAAGRLEGLVAELRDVASDIRAAADAISDDPERLDTIRRRRQQLAELRRKYGETLALVIDERDQIRDRLAELDSHTERVGELTAARAVAEADEAAAASVVAAARKGAAKDLASGIEARLHALAMPEARVRVDVEGPDPADEVAIMLAANPGSEPQPVAKVASGGELSRASLALRLELTAGPPCLVFDEVDAGIGGEAAWSIGGALADLADRHQIVVVTHLAQVAAFADHHVRVRKDQGKSATTARAEVLTDDARVSELARMLSGKPDSSSGRSHAQELLDAAGRS